MRALGRGNPDFDYESRILGKVSRSFALTIPELPPSLARAVTNAYLICRIIDTIEDDEGLELGKKALFLEDFIKVLDGSKSAEQFSESLCALFSGQVLEDEKDLVSNTPTVISGTLSLNARQQAAIRKCAATMARGMLEFQRKKTPRGLTNLGEFDRYCYFVAGIVGEMLTELFCDYSPEIDSRSEKMQSLAVSFGQGLQMTNIIKDIWDDKKRGACWMPRSVFERVGCDLEGLSTGTEPFGQAISEMIGIARGHLKNALAYTMLIPPEEAGIRKFCLWAIGMAVFTLRNVHKNLDYRCGADVKISRRTLKSIIFFSNLAQRSNFLLERMFELTTRGLPPSRKKAQRAS